MPRHQVSIKQNKNNTIKQQNLFKKLEQKIQRNKQKYFNIQGKVKIKEKMFITANKIMLK